MVMNIKIQCICDSGLNFNYNIYFHLATWLIIEKTIQWITSVRIVKCGDRYPQILLGNYKKNSIVSHLNISMLHALFQTSHFNSPDLCTKNEIIIVWYLWADLETIVKIINTLT